MQICKTHNVSFSSIIHNRDCLAVLAKATPLIMTPIHPSFAKIDFLISSFRQIPIKKQVSHLFSNPDRGQHCDVEAHPPHACW